MKSNVMLVIRYNGSTAYRTGSSVAIQIGSKYFLATSGHFLTNYKKGTLEAVTHAPSLVPITKFSKVEFDENLDLGLIELDSKTAKRLGCNFVPESNIMCKFDSDMQACVVGFPDKIKGNGFKQILCPYGIIDAEIVPFSKWPKNLASRLISNRDVVLSVSGNITKNDIAGISGGGIYVDEMLVGIQVGILPKSKLTGRKIGSWLDFVVKHYPSLQDKVRRIKMESVKEKIHEAR